MPTDPSPFLMDLVAGALATPDHPNNNAEFSQAWQDLFEVAHRESDQEHRGPEVAQCSGTVRWSGAAYSIVKGKGISLGAGQIARTAAGDVTITMDGVEMASILDYGVDAFASPAAEPLFVKEYDDTATTNTRTTKKFRLHIWDQNGAYKDGDFRFAVYGARARLSIATPVGVAVTDVRNRLAVDGVESVELRNKITAFYRAKLASLAEKHYGPGPNHGKHRDICVPHVALFRTPTAPATVGSLVFASSGFYRTEFFHSGSQSQIKFKLKPNHRWIGARATVRHTDATAAPNALRDRSTNPRLSNLDEDGYELGDRVGRWKLDLGSPGVGSVSGIRQVLLVVHARIRS